MSYKFFGQFLLEKGLIDSEQLLEVLDTQKASNPTLGALAVEYDHIKEEMAERINKEQQRTDKRFGEIAVDLGILTTEQVDELFEIQKTKRKYFGEILVEKGYISEEVLQAELSQHIKENAIVIQELNDTVNGHEHGELLSNAIDTVVKMFSRIPKIQVKFSKAVERPPHLDESQRVCIQTMYMPEPVEFGWVINRELSSSISTGFLGIDLSDFDDVRNDSAREFLNIILGQVAAFKAGLRNQSRLDPPEDMPANEFSVAEKNSFYIEMNTAEESFTLFFLY